jgi:hypothetical protein
MWINLNMALCQMAVCFRDGASQEFIVIEVADVRAPSDVAHGTDARRP